VFVALRAMTIQGHTYQSGDPVDVTGWAPGKVEQLTSHRMLRDTETDAALAPYGYVALRTFQAGSHSYTRGQMVDVSGLTPIKRGQLLESRYLEPAAPPRVAMPTAAPAPPKRKRGRPPKVRTSVAGIGG
jgi:hypothetical protein